MTKREQVEKYLKEVYVPIAKRDEVANLLKTLDGYKVSEIGPECAHKGGLRVLLIEKKGVGPRSSYSGHLIGWAEFGSVGKTFADVYVRGDDGQTRVARVGVKTPNVALLEEIY